MSVKLSHIGELLIAEMLTQIALRRQLSQIACAVTGITLADDIKNQGIEIPGKKTGSENFFDRSPNDLLRPTARFSYQTSPGPRFHLFLKCVERPLAETVDRVLPQLNLFLVL